MNFIIAAKFTHPIQRVIQASSNWIVLDTGIEICEQFYKPRFRIRKKTLI
jgi:hypothetical protein